MGRVFCIANRKGGVGKTTTAISLAAGLARSGLKTLLVDLDPQCNATSGVGVDPIPRHPLADGSAFISAVQKASTPGLEILPGSRAFSEIEWAAASDAAKLAQMTKQFREGIALYDYVVLDTPPSLGHFTRMALAWSTEVIMPIQCEYYAMEGLVGMIELIRDLMASEKGTLSLAGIVMTMFDPSLEFSVEVDRDVREHFGEIVYKTAIPRDAAVSEAPSHGKSIFEYAPRSRGARAYAEFCLEVLEYV